MRLLDEGGLRALTLRSVAQQVGVAPASLYSRVESVDDLFDLALDTALADDPVMSESIRNADLPALIHAFLSTSRPTGGPAW
ncbi:Bacterial regulatory protein, tetR family [Brevibacterium ravenspurgense]|uniref:Bacterial regulatory protein, tetR family n=1 Tax=Brevibacterium ravenspurgense TaxID=479117 RepID=A0A150H860_9MICO|nr:Bacterial regulatory protein, tetR family [Brevibacterium ravenspurgense]